MLFSSNTKQEVWLEHWCRRCWKESDCPIKERALRTERKPKEWTRNARDGLMKDQYKCGEFQAQPPLVRRKGAQQFEDVPMFDVDPATPVHLVPVEGWPDKPPPKGVDHA